MGKQSADIMEGDEESDIKDFFLDICGVENEEELTKEIWEKNLDKILDFVRQRSKWRITYLVFGYFTLLLGAELPAHLRPEILDAARWDHEKDVWLDEGFKLEREFYLADFSSKIRDYRAGKPVYLVQLKNFEEDLLQGVVGIHQFWEFTLSNKIHSVKHMNLDSCELEEIPKPIFNLKNIETLSLEHNHIKEIPLEIGNLINLKELYLTDNLISELPNTIGNLTSLKLLYLNNNNINSFNENISKLSSLEMLFLSNNSIKSLPKSILNMKSLSRIYLINNKMEELPPFLKKAPFYILLRPLKFNKNYIDKFFDN